MGRRRTLKKKKRQKSGGGAAGENPSAASSLPGSFVVKGGRVAPGVRQLTADWRRVMSPYVSLRLKESRRNKTKDFIAVANPLGATHLQTFTQTEHAAYLKIARLPRGPTCVFQIVGFSLIRDVQRLRRGVRFDPRDFATAPVLVLSAGNKASSRKTPHPQSEAAPGSAQSVELLVSEMIRSAFAPIDVRTAKLSDCRRVVFFRQVADASGLRFRVRQYSVSRKAARLTSGVERVVEAFRRKSTQRLLLQRGSLVKNAGNGAAGGAAGGDVCDFLLREERGESGTLSADEEPPAAEVAVAKEALPKKINKGSSLQLLLGTATAAPQSEEAGADEELRMAVALKEIGPRLDLQLVKVEDDVHSGKVLYHRHVEKSPEELAALKVKEAALKAKREQERQKLLELLTKQRQSKEAALDDGASSSASGRKRASDSDEENGDEEAENDKRPSKRAKFNPFSFRPSKPSAPAPSEDSKTAKPRLLNAKGKKNTQRGSAGPANGRGVSSQHRKVLQKFARSKASSS